MPPLSAGNASPWDDVVTLYRRICLLRCSGREAEAARLQERDLASSLQAITPPGGETAAFITYRDGLFQLEAERVQFAHAVAELLAPLLLERLGPRAESPRSAPLRPPGVPRHPAASGPADIADMIDSMLDQQRELNAAGP